MPNDLSIHHVSLSIDGRTLLDRISHCFAAGTVTLLLGRSGSGKTVLLETLAGLRKPVAGDIRLGSSRLWQGRSPGREQLLAFGSAFQQPERQLFAGTIAEEFRYTLQPYRKRSSGSDRERLIGEALRRAMGGDAPDWLERNPFTLSGGQKRRLSMALLDAADPDWLLLDEPTAGMDREAVNQLRDRLQAHKASGKGAIVVTHDPEALLAVSDQVVLLHGGQLAWRGTPARLAEEPQAFEMAGMAIPDRLLALRQLQNAGYTLPAGWPDAKTTAAALAKSARAKLRPEASPPAERRSSATETVDAQSPLPATACDGPAVPHVQMPVAHDDSVDSHVRTPASHNDSVDSHMPTGSVAAPGQALTAHDGSVTPAGPTQTAAQRPSRFPAAERVRPLDRFDPRAVWLAYMLLTPGILLQSTWTGWFAGALLAYAAIRFTAVPYRAWSKPAIGLSIFTLIVSVTSGLQFDSSFTFAVVPAVDSFYQFSRLVMIMLIGFTLLSSIPPLRLRRALEQALSGLRHIRLPVEQFALTAALMVRFIPVLLQEWNRFSLIAAARGKYPLRPGRVPLRSMRVVVIPFLMALMRLGDVLSTILIARGVGRADRKPTMAFRLSFHWRDLVLLMIAAIILLAFIALAHLNIVPRGGE